MGRITIKTLRAVCANLNRMTGSPMEPYKRDADGKLTAQIGCYIIDCAYGGYQLARIMNECGGQTSPFGLGFGTARETYDKMRAYMAGLQDAKEAAGSLARDGEITEALAQRVTL